MRTFEEFLKEEHGVDKDALAECPECDAKTGVGPSSGPGSEDEKTRKLKFKKKKK